MLKRLVIVEFKMYINSDFDQYDVQVKIDFCMDAFEYVYEIFTVTQLTAICSD